MNKRIIKEVAEFQKMAQNAERDGRSPEFHAEFESDGDITKLKGYITGPIDSVYKDFKYNLTIALPSDYPIKPPKIMFKSKIYHPNVDMRGEICLDILKDKWTPVQNIRTAMLSIQSIMSDPNPDSALNGDAAILYTGNREKLREIVCKMAAEDETTA